MVKMTPGYISSGLVQNSVSPTTYVPPSKRDYEILFQPLFDEYFNPPPCAVSLDPVAVAAPRPVDPAGSPLSTTIDQDVPSASTSPTNQEIQFQVTRQGVEEQIHRHQNAQFDNAPLLQTRVLKKQLYKGSKCENKGIVPTEMELELEQTQQGSSHEVSDYIEMEMQIPRSSIVKFIDTCSYLRLNHFKTSRKSDPKLPQTLISTSSSVCQSDEVMN
ncbi:hypothetical protein Tco_1092670 [Tanacetum coccineum]|uniref:Uncharacterized protein n=1 Tax=Tanacetum coccineum TaxID=301880 RepID=A0ABQ5ICJ0_9ASTR